MTLALAFLPIKKANAVPVQSETFNADSLLTVNAIRSIALTDPDQALSLLDLAEERNSFPQFQIDWTRAQIYGGPKRMERMAAKWGKRFGAQQSPILLQYVQEPDRVDDRHPQL